MLEALEGTTFENRPYRVCAEKVAEFVDVTGDDPKRWTDVAPPGFAAALLFVVAPELLEDPRVRGGVVHGDQTFAWHSPLRVETQGISRGKTLHWGLPDDYPMIPPAFKDRPRVNVCISVDAARLIALETGRLT